MPNDLERAFGELAADTDRAQLLPAAEIRRLSGRRSRNASLAAALTVAVLVAGVAVGSRWVLTGETGPRPLPPLHTASVPPTSAPTPAPSASGPPARPSSAPPTSVPPTSSGPVIPKSIPARAMLNVKDGNTGQFKVEEDARRAPKLCPDTSYPSASKAAVRKSVYLLYRRPELSPDTVPDDTIYHTVTVYRGTGAEDFLDDLRAAVRECPNGPEEEKYRSLGSFGAGDESLLIERSTPARDLPGNPVPGAEPTLTYIAAVRIKDTVSLVESTGYENWGSLRKPVVGLAETAAERVAAWRD
jgi:hypothetical protein